jgi:pyridoxal phosphate-dependent aminotransferase EpsN|tara:strand:+ start:2556 stop:3689 length:1134 start_codon:yes stop_codon:yes gene_type:complete
LGSSLNKKIYLSPPHLNGEEIKYIQNAIDSNWVAPLGPHVDAFEKEVSEYVGVQNAAALSSGTAALHLALKILDVNEEDFVFCSDLTFVASANAIRYLGATPVFIDAEESSWNMCPKALVKAFKSYMPKAVVVTDLYGQSADYDSIIEICEKFKVPLIEDAAESLGAKFHGQQCGSFGNMAILSFNGNKIITTSCGGMLLSNHKQHIEKAKNISAQAREPVLHYEHKEIGYNYRMSNILAALGRAQLKSLDDYVTKRRNIFNYYKKELNGLDQIEFMPEITNGRSTRWLTAIYFKDFTYNNIESILEKFSLENIEARPLWKPMHLQPVFNGFPFITTQKTVGLSDKFFKRGLCLPSGSNLNQDDQNRIISIINNIFI